MSEVNPDKPRRDDDVEWAKRNITDHGPDPENPVVPGQPIDQETAEGFVDGTAEVRKEEGPRWRRELGIKDEGEQDD